VSKFNFSERRCCSFNDFLGSFRKNACAAGSSRRGGGVGGVGFVVHRHSVERDFADRGGWEWETVEWSGVRGRGSWGNIVDLQLKALANDRRKRLSYKEQVPGAITVSRSMTVKAIAEPESPAKKRKRKLPASRRRRFRAASASPSGKAVLSRRRVVVVEGFADSGGCRSAFRTDVDHDSEVMPISVPN
jgi:hypothetical protein